MLDEKQEYSDYTSSLTADSIPRLKPSCFVEKSSKKTRGTFMGTERAMTIIARHALFDDFHYKTADSPEKQKEIISQVTVILQSWCGFLPENEQCNYEFANWLKTYYQTFITEKKLGGTLPSWEEIKKSKSKQFTSPVFPAKPSSKSKNNSKAISYSRIIARAVEEGPLCTYYLICKKDFANHAAFKTNKKMKLLADQGKKSTEYKNDVLKFIAVNLIEKSRTGNNYNVVNLTDFSHWIQQQTGSARMKKFFYITKSDSKPLFEFTKVINGNTMKCCVCSEYIEEYDFRIITEKELSEVKDDYICFKDDGFGKPLKIV